MDQIFKRTSIRRYLDQPVEAEKTEYLLKAAMQGAVGRQSAAMGILRHHEPGYPGKTLQDQPLCRACRKGTYSDRSCCPE